MPGPFSSKPTSARLELEELDSVFHRIELGELLGREPATVSRLFTRERFPRPLERLIDDVWTVVHLAITNGWDQGAIRFYLLSRQPELSYRRPLELLRRGDVEPVIAAIKKAPVVEAAG